MGILSHPEITGTTESRLEEVRGYDVSDPFPIGVVDSTGILEKTGDLLYYQIDHITYVTNIQSVYTYFTLVYNEEREVTNNLEEQYSVRDESDGSLIEPMKIFSYLDIDRYEYSVYDK